MGRFRLFLPVALVLAAGVSSADEQDVDASEEVIEQADAVLPDDDDESDYDDDDDGRAEVDGDGIQDVDQASEEGTDDAYGGKVARTDNRSARGAERGGHAGQVSTMARAGLGPVYGALRSQGYGGMEISEADGRIEVLATRAGERRTLVYDASNGTLLSDESQAASGGLAERLFGSKKTKTDAVAGGRKSEVKSRGANSKGVSRGGKSSGSKSNGQGGAKSSGGSGGGKSSNSRGGGGGGKSNGKSGGKGGKNR